MKHKKIPEDLEIESDLAKNKTKLFSNEGKIPDDSEIREDIEVIEVVK